MNILNHGFYYFCVKNYKAYPFWIDIFSISKSFCKLTKDFEN